MLKHEFERLAGEVTDNEFEIIDFVYTFHPAIDEIKGKQQIADLFKLGGMRLMKDMAPTAGRAKGIEEAINHHVNEIANLRNELAALKTGTN